jgi:hypothetical protein
MISTHALAAIPAPTKYALALVPIHDSTLGPHTMPSDRAAV